ncbi:MAG: PIN domain-containing protein, partial [Parvularculaceae bacterium]|nr:PIN domain-containing protein [Parvularculaceae bacterium]
MPANILVDAGFLIALLSRRDANHRWAVEQAARSPPPWQTCQAVLSEAFFLLGKTGLPALGALLARRAVLCSFPLDDGIADILTLMRKYDDIPMNFADACL